MLHKNPELFEQVILRASEYFGIEAGIIEKDYFVTLFLKKISEVLPSIIFKGGTSLSKCHKLIERFSEDVDLNIECENHPTEGQRKELKRMVVRAIEELELELINADEIASKRDYNKYIVAFPTVFKSMALKQNLIIETAVRIRAYPNQFMKASSMVYEYLSKNGFDEIVGEYELFPFEIRVQSADRTFVDKVFAVCDYYLDGRMREHSRHLYDLYKLLNVVKLDAALGELIKDVREERKKQAICKSAQDGVNIGELLGEIIEKKAYKEDYESITETLLFENVGYNTVIEALQTVRNSNLF